MSITNCVCLFSVMATRNMLPFYCIFLLASAQLCLTNQNCSYNNCRQEATIYMFDMKTELGEKEVHISWEFNSSIPIYGFCSVILDKEKSVIYRSPMLQSNERKMTLSYELTDSDSLVCLRVMVNQTEILDQKCDSVEVSDLKIIIGILAGTIFIIPCIIAMACILYKDYNVRKQESYEQLIQTEEKGELPSKTPMSHESNEISHDSHVNSDENKPEKDKNKSNKELKGVDNASFVLEKSNSRKETNNSDGIDKTPVIKDNHEDNDTDSQTTIQSSDNSKRNITDMTLKVDIQLARQMAQSDNEINTYSVKL